MKGLIPILALVIVALLIFTIGRLQVPAAILPSGSCYTSGTPITVQSDPVKVLSPSNNAYFCSVWNYIKKSGGIEYSTNCNSIGSVSTGQVIQTRTINWVIPSDAQLQQTNRVNLFVTDNLPANDVEAYQKRISDIDRAEYKVQSACVQPSPGTTPVPSGERNVYYFKGCFDNKLTYCTKEYYDATTSRCTFTEYASCQTGAVCRASPDGKVGMCIKDEIAANPSSCESGQITTKFQCEERCDGKWRDPGILEKILGEKGFCDMPSVGEQLKDKIISAGIMAGILAIALFGISFLFPPLKMFLSPRNIIILFGIAFVVLVIG